MIEISLTVLENNTCIVLMSESDALNYSYNMTNYHYILRKSDTLK